ncbi:MAG: TonB-dependent receptor, partial [Bacteroidetes bacterium]|nr:TonB-dependent receptor [Bacteroidota bacterium]
MKKLFIPILGLLVNIVVGQDLPADTTKIYPLKEVVITATRSEKNPADVGRSITLITSENIQNSVNNNVSELLSNHEGMYIVGNGQNFGMHQSIFMRGASSNHTTIMVDNIRITDPSTVNNAPNLSELSLANIDRIEIVRGSHSTLFGSSAIGGVVNFITPKNQSKELNANVEFKAGTFGRKTSMFSENLFLNYSMKNGLYISGEVYNSNVKGLDATVDTVTDQNVFKNRDMDDFNHTDIIGKIGYSANKLDIFGSFQKTKQKTDIDKRAFVDDDNATLDFKRNLFTYGASYELNDILTLKYIGGYSTMKRRAVDDSSVIDKFGNNDHTYSDDLWNGRTSTNEIQANFQMNGIGGVIGGGLYSEFMSAKNYFYTRSIFGEYTFSSDLDSLRLNTSTKNIFVHLDVNGSLVDKEFKNFSIAFGSRLNRHNTFGNKPTFTLNPSLKINNNALVYASYSTGFNAPSLYQFYAPNKDFISGIPRGNKNLKPETSSSFEIGFKQNIDNVWFGVSFYNTVTDNMIEYVYLWDKNIRLDTLGNDWMRNDFRGDTYLNIGRQTTKGVEFYMSSKLMDNLVLSGNFSLVSGKL